MKAWNVFIATQDGECLVDTIFCDDDIPAEDVRKSLIDHDGYHSSIYVRAHDPREVNLELNPNSFLSKLLRGQA